MAPQSPTSDAAGRRSVKLAAFGAAVGIREIAYRRVEAVEKADNQNPAGVVLRPLDIGDLRLGCARGGGDFNLL